MPRIFILGISYKMDEKYVIKYMHLIDLYNSMQAIVGFHTLNMSQIVLPNFDLGK